MKEKILNFLYPFFLSMAINTGAVKFFDFTDLDKPAGPNIGGFTIECYIIEVDNIDTEAVVAAAPTDYSEMVTLVGNHILVALKNFAKVYVTPRTLSNISETQGEIDGKSFKPTGEFFYPGSKAEAMGFAAKIKDSNIILIAIDPNDGNRTQFGNKLLPVFVSPRVEFGAAAPDRRGVFCAFECDSLVPGYIYNGSIPLDSETLPPIS